MNRCDMIKTMGRIMILVSLLLNSIPTFRAIAADEWETKKTKSGIVKYKKKTVYEFTGSDMEGKVKTPSGAFVSTRKKIKIDRLIKLRTEFDNEVDASAAGTR